MSIRKKQFKLFLDPDTLDRLENIAVKMGRRNAQEIIEELIRYYLPVLSSVHESFNRALQYQMNAEAEIFAAKQSQTDSSGDDEKDISSGFGEDLAKGNLNIPRLINKKEEESHGLNPNPPENIKRKRRGK